MKLLGIDAGFTALGIAVVDAAGPGYGKVLHAGCFQTDRTPPKKRASVTDDDVRRIMALCGHIEEIASQYSVDAVIAELPTGGAKGAGAIKGMAFSTCLTAAAIYFLRVPFTVINPYQNKRASGGQSRSDKSAVMTAVGLAWPDIVWPRMKKKDALDLVKCEAMADALSCILARLKGQV